MSKWSNDFTQQMKDIKAVRKATKEVIAKGGKLGAEEIHEASSVERLKKIIRES